MRLFILFALVSGACVLARIKKRSRTLRAVSILAAAAAVLELTVFQFPSYRLTAGNYPHTVLPLSEADISAGEYDDNLGGIMVQGTDEITFTFRGMDIPVGTVYLDVEFQGSENGAVNFFADMTDETGHYYRMKLVDSEIIPGSARSQYAMTLLSGSTSAIRFRISGQKDDDSLIIRGAELNRPIPFDIIPLRFVLIVLAGTFLYAVMFSGVFGRKYESSRRLCIACAACVTAAAMYLTVLLAGAVSPDVRLADKFRQTEGDQITEELVLAFEKGHVYLDAVPDERLLEMENPYDWGTRYYEDIQYSWDHVLYNGRYYSYYGIAPLLLFLPYHKLTGHFFPTDVAVALFSCVGILFLTLLYDEIVRRRFGKLTVGIYASGLIALLAVCGIWFSAGRPKFYEIAVSSGFACTAAGAYLLISANVLGGGKVRLLRTAAASLLLGLAVMCRPTLAMYAVCGCVFFVLGAGKVRRSSGGKFPAAYLACAYLPMAILAAVQMWYNYARFGSPFEFGIQYSLTVNDFTHTQFHLHLMLIGLYNFLLAPPAFLADYPYVTTPFSQLGANGYYFIDEGNTSGALFLALPVFGYILGGRALKRLADAKSRIRWLVIAGLPCVVMPLIIVCSVWESGYAARYTADFSWQITFGALILLYFLYCRCENETKKRFFTAAMAFSALWAVLVGGIQIYNFAFPKSEYPYYADLLARLLSPWR